MKRAGFWPELGASKCCLVTRSLACGQCKVAQGFQPGLDALPALCLIQRVEIGLKHSACMLSAAALAAGSQAAQEAWPPRCHLPARSAGACTQPGTRPPGVGAAAGRAQSCPHGSWVRRRWREWGSSGLLRGAQAQQPPRRLAARAVARLLPGHPRDPTALSARAAAQSKQRQAAQGQRTAAWRECEVAIESTA